MDKNNIINNVYKDKSGFSSIQKTYKEANTKDSTITLQNVRDWFAKNVERKKQLKGYNSFINDGAQEEYQVDLAFFKAKDKIEIGLVMIDIFSKYAVVIPIASKETPDVIAGMMEGFQKMGGKPKCIYSDNEGALGSSLFDEFCESHKVKLITTRTHAWGAERFIRTLKDMINKRIENTEKTWKDVLFEVLLTYNNKNVHTATGLTPDQAKLDKYRLQVKMNLELHRISKRRYPTVDVDDKVKLYKKKGRFDKENTSVWLPQTHTIALITESMGQKFYHITGHKKPFLRHEILKI
jgi:transposase InsO family protein